MVKWLNKQQYLFNPNSCGAYDIVTDFISLFGPIGLYTSIEMSNVHQQFHELEPILQDNYKDYRLNQFNKIYSANDYTNFDLINDSVYEDVKCIWNNLIGGIKSWKYIPELQHVCMRSLFSF